MKAVYFCAFCMVYVLVAKTDAQYGFMDGFMSGFNRGMDNMMRNLGNSMGNLQVNLQNMGQRMSREYARQNAVAETYARDLPPGQGRQINDGNIRGYVFRNRDGSLSYSLGNGGSSGYFYHSGPDGTYSQRW